MEGADPIVLDDADQEIVQWTGDVEVMTEGEKKAEVRNMRITDCCIYLSVTKGWKKEFIVYAIFHIIRCTVMDDISGITVVFSDAGSTPFFVVKTPEYLSIKACLLTQWRRLTWNINPRVFPGLEYLDEAQAFPAPVERPEHLCFHRYFSEIQTRKEKVEESLRGWIRGFEDAENAPGAKPFTALTTPAGSFSTCEAFMYALAMEAKVRSLTFQVFCPDVLGKVLNWIMIHPNRLTEIVLSGYTGGDFSDMEVDRSVFNHLSTVTLFQCHGSFVNAFAEAMMKVNFSIRCLVLWKIDSPELMMDKSGPLLRGLDDTTFFSNLQTLILYDCKTRALAAFVQEVVVTSASLKELALERCNIDACQLLSSLNKVDCKIQTLRLRGNNCRFDLPSNEGIPASIIQLDVGRCKWTAAALSAFMMALFRWNRKLPLALVLSECKFEDPEISLVSVFAELPILGGVPSVITELNVSSNPMKPKGLTTFLKVLGTQTLARLSREPKKLMHLCMSKCFGPGCNRTKCMSILKDFFVGRELWGFELGGCYAEETEGNSVDLINCVASIPGLVSLDISGNYLSKKARAALLKFVGESSTIAEIGVDNIARERCREDQVEQLQMLRFYEAIVVSSRIVAMRRPILDLAAEEVAGYAETASVNTELMKKRQISTQYERLSLYLSLFSEFAMRVTKPYKIATNSSNEDDLLASDFKNPIRSLFMMAAISSVDVMVDPLASMITEYIATTTGKRSVSEIPPTVPPTTDDKEPDRRFEPIVFGTMTLDPGELLEVDTTSDAIRSVSVSVAAAILESEEEAKRKADKDGDDKKGEKIWSVPKKMTTMPAVWFKASAE